jgi:segregation and condensation protein B
MVDLKKEVEAILFSAGRAVTLKELQSLLHLNDPGLIKETIRELKDDYESKDSPLMILAEEEGWKLTVKEKFLQIVQKINPHTELSKTILETLSVIAWKQPVLQSEVIKIRTNKAYDHIAELHRLGFVSKERQGRSFLLKITPKFLDYFDLPDDKAIKEVFKEFKDIAIAVKKKVGESNTETAKPEGEEMKKQEKEKGAEETTEGVELESYIDVPPPMHKPKKGTDLEVYDLPPEEIKEEAEEEKKKEEKEEKEKEIKEEAPKETPAEKARRIARELVGEEPVKTPHEEEVEERKLHPKLEEFVAGEAEQLAPKKTEKTKKPEEKKEKEPEQPEEEKEEKKETPAVEPAKEESGKEKEVVAEEYPGQFEKEKKLSSESEKGLETPKESQKTKESKKQKKGQ